MPYRIHVTILAFAPPAMAADRPPSGHGATSFDNLPQVLKAGTVVYVTDTAV